MQMRKVGLGMAGNQRRRPARKQQRLELAIVHFHRQRPAKLGLAGALEVLGDRPLRNAGGGSDPLVAEVGLELEPDNFLDLAHGLPVGRHPASPKNRGA